MADITSFAGRFLREEEGIASVWHVMTAITLLSIGGFAIDHSRVMSEQIRLQVAADTVAHAAAWALVTLDEDEPIEPQLEAARTAGMTYASRNLMSGRDEAILGPDVEFGTWDQATRTFTVASSDIDAVRVVSRRTAERGNPLPTTYLGLVDLPSFNVAAQAIFQLKVPMCAQDGILSMGTVDISSNNEFESGFCVHGQLGVAMQNDNTFHDGAIVSMPSLDLLDVPSLDGNPGLEDALRQERHNPPELASVVATMNQIIAGDTDSTGEWFTGGAIEKVSVKGDLTPSVLTEGKAHDVSCKGKNLFVDGSFKNVLIRTDCNVTFRSGVQLDNVVFMSSSTDKRAFDAPSGLSIGRDDSCKVGGNVLLITPGGMNFASKIALHGSQLIAGGDVIFSASGTGVYGGQILAGGNVESTSHIHFGPCPQGSQVVATMRPVMRL